MKDQRAILKKCILEDIPAFVIAGDDSFAIPALKSYLNTAKKNGASQDFLDDMALVLEEMQVFQKMEPEKVKTPKLKEHEIESSKRNYGTNH